MSRLPCYVDVAQSFGRVDPLVTAARAGALAELSPVWRVVRHEGWARGGVQAPRTVARVARVQHKPARLPARAVAVRACVPLAIVGDASWLVDVIETRSPARRSPSVTRAQRAEAKACEGQVDPAELGAFRATWRGLAAGKGRATLLEAWQEWREAHAGELAARVAEELDRKAAKTEAAYRKAERAALGAPF